MFLVVEVTLKGVGFQTLLLFSFSNCFINARTSAGKGRPLESSSGGSVFGFATATAVELPAACFVALVAGAFLLAPISS